MADFKGTVLTQAGRNILAKALTGTQLQFTKVQLGDGVWDESINPENLTALVSSRIDLPINDIEITGDGTARIRVLLTNTGLTEGFFTRELGIFAKDPETGEETLYAVSYAENPDFIPSEGVTKVENIFDVYTVISNAHNVTAVISDTVVLATKQDIKQDIEKHNQDPNAHNGLINAGKLNGYTASSTPSANTIPVADADGFINSWIKQGAGSGLDADLIRGLPPSKFVRTDVPSTIQVDNNFYPLVISGTPNPDNPLDSIGLALYPDKDKGKRVEYSSTRGGEFRIYCARYLTNVLYSDNGNLKFLGHKVWHQGDVAQLLSSSGYIKFPNGLIIQWGRGDTTSDSNGIASFTFPIAFPNACFQVVPVDVGGACYDYGIEDAQINITGFSCYVRYSNGGIAANAPVGIRYIAIGY